MPFRRFPGCSEKAYLIHLSSGSNYPDGECRAIQLHACREKSQTLPGMPLVRPIDGYYVLRIALDDFVGSQAVPFRSGVFRGYPHRKYITDVRITGL